MKKLWLKIVKIDGKYPSGEIVKDHGDFVFFKLDINNDVYKIEKYYLTDVDPNLIDEVEVDPSIIDIDSTSPQFHSLLPLAMQVCAQTIGLELVPVVPLEVPLGKLHYLDFIYKSDDLGTPVFDDDRFDDTNTLAGFLERNSEN